MADAPVGGHEGASHLKLRVPNVQHVFFHDGPRRVGHYLRVSRASQCSAATNGAVFNVRIVDRLGENTRNKRLNKVTLLERDE